MGLPGQCNHLPGDIDSFNAESMLEQEIDEAPTAAAANIQCKATSLCELDGTFELMNSVRLKVWLLPEVRNRVVTAADIIGVHFHDLLRLTLCRPLECSRV